MVIKAWQVNVSIVLISAITILMQIPSDTWFTTASTSLILGASALACMAVSCILASRWRFVEKSFGGLDRVYQAHKWIAIWALIFAVYHFVFKAKLDAWDLAPIIELSKSTTRLFRQLSLVALGFIIILALNRKIPYSKWRVLHKLSGPLFLIVILHWLSFKSPITLTSPSGIWLAGICGLGVIAAFYKLVLYPFMAKTGLYKIASVSHANGALHLELAPVRNKMSFKPGQFAFISLKVHGMHEPHPFTIASAPCDTGNIHFVIRSLGDYTKKLCEKAEVGMLADVYAPYGNFKRNTHAKREVWIGAGVGISPFISWLEDEDVAQFDHATLIYCYSPSRAFPSLERIQEIATSSGVEVVPNPSGSNAIEEVLRKATQEFDPSEIQVSFCGPQGLLTKVQALMKQYHIPAKNINYEFFDFR